MLKDKLLNTKGLQFDNWRFVPEKYSELLRNRSKAGVALSLVSANQGLLSYTHIVSILLRQRLALTVLPSRNQTLVICEMNCLDSTAFPPFTKEVYVVAVPCFMSSTFPYVHSRDMFSCLLLNYGSTSTTLPCLTQYSRVKLAISRSLSTSSPRALPRPGSNIEWDEVQENADLFWYQRDSWSQPYIACY